MDSHHTSNHAAVPGEWQLGRGRRLDFTALASDLALGMNDLAPEVIARAIRWCAEAGRQATAGQVQAALAPLSWDALLAVKALLADPPPARPLGPHALADIARGAPAVVAAEREREGRYLGDAAFEEPPGTEPSVEPPTRRARRKAAPRAAPVRVRRARDRTTPEVSAPPPLPSLDELRRPEGRAVLERLIRQLGPKRSALAEALASGWRHADGTSITISDVSSLLDEHGLKRPFERRERALLLHALRVAGGARPRAAAQLGVSADEFQSALERLGATREAEVVREEWRADVRRRATLSERVRLLATDEGRLADLGLLDQVLADLRARLPEHLRALRSAETGSLAPALGRSLSLPRSGVEALAQRFGLDLGGRSAHLAPRAAPRAASRTSRAPPRTSRGPRRTAVSRERRPRRQ